MMKVNLGAPPEQQAELQSSYLDENYCTKLRPVFVKEFGSDDLTEVEENFRIILSRLSQEAGRQNKDDVHRIFNMAQKELSKQRTALENKS